MSPAYRHEARSLPGFIQQLAVAYVTHGYFFYTSGLVPEGKLPNAVDAKLIRKYGADLSRWARARRKRAGLSNVHYLRHGRFFVLLATKGEHRFFSEEGERVRDIRRDSLSFAGYSIGWKLGSDRKGHPSVRIHPKRYLELRDHFLELATRRSAENLALELGRIPFEPYAPVRSQLLSILRKVNLKRRESGFEPVPASALRLRRGVVFPFGPPAEEVGEVAA
jgi:hypothetical protein